MPSREQKLHIFSLPIKKEVRQTLWILFIFLTSIACYNFATRWQPTVLLNIGLFPKFVPNTTKKDYCDYSYGKWVRDETQPRSKYSENCPFLDPGFQCQQNGRKDLVYQKWRWQPQACNLPRFDALDFLQRSRNGRIVFAGDSIVRNHWESLICMLSQGVSNQSTIYEENGKPITRHKGFLSIKFAEFNLTVEYYRAPYLVMIARTQKNASEQVRGVVRVDQLHWFSEKWVGADVLVFSPGHWWNRDKTINSGFYFQEGEYVNMTMDVMEALKRSLQTLERWAVQHLVPEKSHVFFRSYSPVHYSDGDWNTGGHCNTSTEPEKEYKNLKPEPLNNIYIDEVVKQMGSAMRNVRFLNISYLTEIRKDGHPSNHREPGTPVNAPQDCSHWCLPGVPDTWNELLYAELLNMGFQTKM